VLIVDDDVRNAALTSAWSCTFTVLYADNGAEIRLLTEHPGSTSC
jgi:hypothetical protein